MQQSALARDSSRGGSASPRLTTRRVCQAPGFFEAVVDSAPDPVFVKDLEGRYVFVNRAGAACLQRTVDEVLGRTNHELLDREMADALQAHDDEALASNTATTRECRGPGGDGRRVYSMTKSPLRDAGGRIIGVVGVARDVTEQKRLQEQFLQAQKMEAIGRLAGGIAHDFNNLLTIILGCVDDVRSQDGEISEAGIMIRDAAERAAGLTAQLLAFSRRRILQPQVVELNALIANVERMLRRVIGEDIVLESILSPGAGVVCVDPGQFEQALMNLAVNARDAMPGGGRLLVETRPFCVTARNASEHPAVPRGAYAMVSMTDTGVGMSADTLARIFEPFFTTKGNGGTGLGLATARAIVSACGGDIWAASAPGKGTTFHILVPRIARRVP